MEPPDIYNLVTTVVRIEAGLRLLAHYPEKYTPDGHYDKIANLLTVLQAEVDHWLDERPGGTEDHRQGQRRQQPDRRLEARRTGTERRAEPPDPEVTA